MTHDEFRILIDSRANYKVRTYYCRTIFPSAFGSRFSITIEISAPLECIEMVTVHHSAQKVRMWALHERITTGHVVASVTVSFSRVNAGNMTLYPQTKAGSDWFKLRQVQRIVVQHVRNQRKSSAQAFVIGERHE